LGVRNPVTSAETTMLAQWVDIPDTVCPPAVSAWIACEVVAALSRTGIEGSLEPTPSQRQVSLAANREIGCHAACTGDGASPMVGSCGRRGMPSGDRQPTVRLRRRRERIADQAHRRNRGSVATAFVQRHRPPHRGSAAGGSLTATPLFVSEPRCDTDDAESRRRRLSSPRSMRRCCRRRRSCWPPLRCRLSRS